MSEEDTCMQISEKQICEELLWDLICYEFCCGRLSPEAKHLLDRHLTECPECHRRIRGFTQMVQNSAIVRNYG